MTIKLWNTGGGCKAYKVTESDVPNMFAYVTDQSYGNIPEHPDSDILAIGVYKEHGETVSEGDMLELRGRPDLIQWYVENVGYDPDDELGSSTPILDLLDRVVSMILLHRGNEV